MTKTIGDYLQLVNSKDIEVVADALEHLAGYADVRAVTAIQTAYFHPDYAIRAAAAYVTTFRLDEKLFDALLSLLDDEEPEVRLAAVVVLGKFADKGIHTADVISELLKRQPEPQTNQAVKDILIKTGHAVIPLLEMELVSFDESRSQRALDVLPHLGDLGIMALIEHIPQLQQYGRRQAAKALGSLNHPMLADYFLNMMSSEDLETRRFAAAAIRSSAFSIKAIEVCGHTLLHDPNQEIRFDAANYLTWTKHPMIRIYFDAYDASKEKGIYGKWIRETINDGYRLLELQSFELKQVHELLFTGTNNDRILAAVEITRRQDPVSIPFLMRSLLIEASSDVQGHILVSLEDLEAQEAVDDILNFLNNVKTDREEALAYDALGELGHPKALPRLQAVSEIVLHDERSSYFKPVQAAREAVDKIHTRLGFLKQTWFQLGEDEDVKRIYIAMMFAMRGDGRGIDLLIKEFNHLPHPALRYHFIRALGMSGSVFVLPFLVKQLVKPEERLVWHAVLAIGQLPLSKAPAELTAMMLDASPVVRSAVLFTMGRLKDPETLPLILRRMDDTDPQVRALAVQTLHSFKAEVDWQPWLNKAGLDSSQWVRLELARLVKAKNLNLSPDIIKHLLVDAHLDVRMAALNIAQYQLSEDMREVLQTCAAIKGGYAPRKARELLDNLDYWKDPDAYHARKEQEERDRRAKEKAARERKLRRQASKTLKRMAAERWESVFITSVAGTSYINWVKLYPGLQNGDVLALVREPHNEVDANAIMLQDEQGAKLGYVPQYRNKRLAKQMDDGFQAVAVVLDIDFRGRMPHMTVELFKKRAVEG